MHLRFLLTLLSFLFLEQTDLPSNDDPSQDPPNDDDPSKQKNGKPDGVTDEIQTWINGLMANERKTARQQGKKDAEDAAETQRKKDADEAQRTKDEQAGEYEKAKTSLTNERDTAITERDGLKTENDALTAYFTAQYDVALKDMPEAITAFAPEDDASFETKSRWLTKAQEQATKLNGQKPTPGNGPTGKPGEKSFDEQQEIARARRNVRPI